jgi:protein gp37
MGETTGIAWTDHTFNPWWGCVKVAPECEGCYAEAFDKRVGGAHWGPTAPRRFFGEKHWAEPVRWNRLALKAETRRRVFCGSMCDVFEDRPEVYPVRERLWSLIHETPQLDWLLLTKRPENVAEMLPAFWGDGWPNVWLGTSIGHPSSGKRLSELRRVPAAVRFISAEPLLAPWVAELTGIDWLIVGGESGAKARPMEVEWARGLRDCARRWGVAFFMKQLGGKQDHHERIAEFPADLQIREFPRSQP